MDSIFPYFGHWVWFIAAAILLLLELLAPGVFFIWLGLAAVGTGLLDLVVPMSWQVELAVFAVLSVVFLLVGRPLVMRRINQETDQPNLNQRNQQYIGKRFMLDEPISGGKGFLTINDTRWHIRGKDLPKGSWVKITGVDGLELLVEADGQ